MAGRRVHVICGGGTGVSALNALVRSGCLVTAGVHGELEPTRPRRRPSA